MREKSTLPSEKCSVSVEERKKATRSKAQKMTRRADAGLVTSGWSVTRSKWGSAYDAEGSLCDPQTVGGAEENQNAMQKEDYAKWRRIMERHGRVSVQPMVSTLVSFPSEVLGREAAADSSTMRLNSTTTSGEILSQSKLRV